MLSSCATSLALAILAEEEFAKGFLLLLVGRGVIPWSNAVWRAARDHSCKHLLCALMEYADPDVEEVLARMKRFEARHEAMMNLFDDMRRLPPLREVADLSGKMAVIEKQNALWREVAVLKTEQGREDAFPPHVAHAINILRHAKIGRWECGYSHDDEKYDPAAQALADGARDREKQRALYVGISKTGAICSSPNDVTDEEVEKAVERSQRLRQGLRGLMEHGGVGVEFDRLIENLKVMFASEEELRILLSDEHK
jgi:hypothetical protein